MASWCCSASIEVCWVRRKTEFMAALHMPKPIEQRKV